MKKTTLAIIKSIFLFVASFGVVHVMPNITQAKSLGGSSSGGGSTSSSSTGGSSTSGGSTGGGSSTSSSTGGSSTSGSSTSSTGGGARFNDVGPIDLERNTGLNRMRFRDRGSAESALQSIGFNTNIRVKSNSKDNLEEELLGSDVGTISQFGGKSSVVYAVTPGNGINVDIPIKIDQEAAGIEISGPSWITSGGDKSLYIEDSLE